MIRWSGNLTYSNGERLIDFTGSEIGVLCSKISAQKRNTTCDFRQVQRKHHIVLPYRNVKKGIASGFKNEYLIHGVRTSEFR